ncbi:unknown protein [Seminavis robusta]|uniref:Uncharacterized protein n=1 Tax=Seminavis robusta TaxID=568900 RepID=A0A9N8HNN4_9STRA|nr:unknown protein [Seminavis robusta]|eukprot:Sro1233_g254850.1 n/a (249) ;mRNA; f:30959-31773
MSGSHKQASRRSAVDEDWERPTTFELAKKRTLNCSLQEKKDRLVTPIVDQRDDILKTVKKKLPGPNPTTNSPIYDALDRAIPKSFAKTANGEKMAKAVLGMYSALNACIEVLEEDGARVPRLLSRHFEELKLAIDSATANFQANALSKCSSVFVALTTQQKERCYKQNGFLPTDEAHRICVGCKHQFVDEPDTNKTVAEKNKVNRRAFEEKKKQAEEEAKQNKTKPKRMLAQKQSSNTDNAIAHKCAA